MGACPARVTQTVTRGSAIRLSQRTPVRPAFADTTRPGTGACLPPLAAGCCRLIFPGGSRFIRPSRLLAKHAGITAFAKGSTALTVTLAFVDALATAHFEDPPHGMMCEANTHRSLHSREIMLMSTA